MAPKNLEQKVSLLNTEKKIGLVYSDTDIIDQKGAKKSDHWFNLVTPNIDFKRPGKSFFDLMFQNLNLVCCPSVIARRDCYEQVGGFDDRLPFSPDMEMWMRISLFYDVAYLSQSLMQYRFHESNETRRFLDLDLIHIYITKKMLIEKFPSILTEAYFENLVKDSSQRVFDRAVYHFYQGQYKTAMQYLYFLEDIRNTVKEPEIIDAYINQLQSYVKQTNAMSWIVGSDGSTYRSKLRFAGKSPLSQPRSVGLYRYINWIKPYIPAFVKDRLRGLKRYLS